MYMYMYMYMSRCQILFYHVNVIVRLIGKTYMYMWEDLKDHNVPEATMHRLQCTKLDGSIQDVTKYVTASCMRNVKIVIHV